MSTPRAPSRIPRLIPRSYDALLLDLDGTLVDDRGGIHARTLASLRAAREQGVCVMVATGRSELASAEVLATLGMETLAVVYNGAAVWCPRRERLVEERLLSNRTLARALELGRAEGYLTVTMQAGAKHASPPRNAVEEAALGDMHGMLDVRADWDLPAEYVIRVTFYSDRHGTSAEFGAEIERAIGEPVYVTHFPLAALASHRSSPLQVVDVHPPCLGKAEALRVLAESYGIPAERVVAIGDASNDVPMLRAAGLGVAMQESMDEALAVADRVIGSNNSDAIGALVEELFGV